MILKRFNNKPDLEKDLVSRIQLILKSAILKYGDARILLSGGSTPEFIYEALSQLPIDWSKVIVGLVDERFVHQESEFSNARMIANCFENASGFALIPMVTRLNDGIENLKEVNNTYKIFQERIDYCLLGMGEDGHTASLFPGDEASEKSLCGNEIDIIQTMAPMAPEERISCSKEMLTRAQFVDLLILGEKKLKIFQNAKDNHLPIATIMNQTTNGVTYFSEN